MPRLRPSHLPPWRRPTKPARRPFRANRKTFPPILPSQTIKTKATGGISNRGLSAVAAVGTPLGRYEKEMEDAIGMLWYQLVDQHMDVIAPGDVKLHFFINRQGKVEKLHVTSGKPNSVLADVSVEAVSEAPLPPIPPE